MFKKRLLFHYLWTYFIISGMSKVSYWETQRTSSWHFQRDNKHVLQKTEFGEAKISGSGDKKNPAN